MSSKLKHRLTIRADAELVSKAKAKAALEHTTMSEIVRQCLERYVEGFPYQPKLPMPEEGDSKN